MNTYKITARTTIEVKTIVQANSEEEALKVIHDGEREVDICIHGTGDDEATVNWKYADWPDFHFRDPYAEELEDFDNDFFE